MTTAAPRKLGSVADSAGYRVSVEPAYVPEQSDPDARRYIFSYRVQIVNISGMVATLRRRTWNIVDAAGRVNRVHGDGVVGHQPRLGPGQSFIYSSFSSLETNWGTMEGCYELETDEGDTFEIAIGRFFLVADAATAR
jgi:ApaG protein